MADTVRASSMDSARLPRPKTVKTTKRARPKLRTPEPIRRPKPAPTPDPGAASTPSPTRAPTPASTKRATPRRRVTERLTSGTGNRRSETVSHCTSSAPGCDRSRPTSPSKQPAWRSEPNVSPHSATGRRAGSPTSGLVSPPSSSCRMPRSGTRAPSGSNRTSAAKSRKRQGHVRKSHQPAPRPHLRGPRPMRHRPQIGAVISCRIAGLDRDRLERSDRRVTKSVEVHVVYFLPESYKFQPCN